MKFLKFLLASAFSTASAFAAVPAVAHEDTVIDMVAGAAPAPGDICIAAGRDAIGDGAGGIFIGQTTTLSTNLGTVFAKLDADAVKWRRQYDGPVKARWFGAIADDTVSDTPNLASMFRHIAEIKTKHVLLDGGLYQIGQAGRMDFSSAFHTYQTNYIGMVIEGEPETTRFRHEDTSDTISFFKLTKSTSSVADNTFPDVTFRNVIFDDYVPWVDGVDMPVIKYAADTGVNVDISNTKTGSTLARFRNNTVLGTATVTLITGDKIVLWQQTDPTENGIYIVNATAPLTRIPEADSSAEWANGWTCYFIDTQNQYGRIVFDRPVGPFTLDTDPAPLALGLRRSAINTGKTTNPASTHRAKEIVFDSVEFRNCTYHYVNARSSGPTAYRFKDCTIKSTNKQGQIEELYFYHSGADIYFENCKFLGPNPAKFIYAQGYNSMTVEGCVFDKVYQCASFRGGRVVFEGNTITGLDTSGQGGDRMPLGGTISARIGLVDLANTYKIGVIGSIISNNRIHGCLHAAFVTINDAQGIEVIGNTWTKGSGTMQKVSMFRFVDVSANSKEVTVDDNYVEVADGGSQISSLVHLASGSVETRIGDNRIISGTLSSGTRDNMIPITAIRGVGNGEILITGTVEATGSYASKFLPYYILSDDWYDGSHTNLSFSAGGAVVIKDKAKNVRHVSGNWYSDQNPSTMSVGSLLSTPATGRVELRTTAGMREVLESSRGTGSATNKTDLAANFDPKKFASVATASDNRLWYPRLASGGYKTAWEHVVASTSDATYVWTTDPLKRTTDSLDSLINSLSSSFSSTNVWVADENKTFYYIPSQETFVRAFSDAYWDDLTRVNPAVPGTVVTGGKRYVVNAAGGAGVRSTETPAVGTTTTLAWRGTASKNSTWSPSGAWGSVVWANPEGNTITANTPTDYVVTFTTTLPNNKTIRIFAASMAVGDWIEIENAREITLDPLNPVYGRPKTPNGTTIFAASDGGVWQSESPPAAALPIGNGSVNVASFDSPATSSLTITTAGMDATKAVQVVFTPPLPPGVLFEVQPITATTVRLDLLNLSGDRVSITSNAVISQ